MIKDDQCCSFKSISNVDLCLWSHVDLLVTTSMVHFSVSLIGLDTSSRPSVKATTSILTITKVKKHASKRNDLIQN